MACGNMFPLVSSGGRDELVVSLGWFVPVKRFAWSIVEQSRDLIEFVLGV